MVQHISVRVPWHDHGWDGTVCQFPGENNSCLRLKNIYENRNDADEIGICGQCMEHLEEKLPCIGEGSAFMSDKDLVRTTIHPYKKSNPGTHGHFQPTEIVYPAYSFPARPFAWLMKSNAPVLKEHYGIDIDLGIEPVLNFETNWIQEARNHKAIFDYFYGDVVPDQSLVIAYAKQVPFVEDHRRVIIGIGHVKRVVEAVEHKHSDEGSLRSLTWETHVCHSIRPNHDDGFVIPYQEMMKYAETHPEFDMSSITVFAPDDAFEEFSYATEQVSYDAMIDVILSCIKSFQIINDCLEEDYSNVIQWLNARLAEVWEDRGAFPGLGSMLSAMEVPLGVLIAKQIKEQSNDKGNLWDIVDKVFMSPQDVLPENLAVLITPIMKQTWIKMSDERKKLFKLLSRFQIGLEQAKILFIESDRIKNRINSTDKDIIENPYVIYEQTRLKQEGLYVSVKKVDRAIFPIPEISEKYPLEEPSRLTSDNDQRRIRAIAISVLECAASNGNTILPCTKLVDEMREMTFDPPCAVTSDIIKAVEKFMLPEILKREMKDGTEYYKLVRIQEFDDIIEHRISRRLNAPRLTLEADWSIPVIQK